MRKQEVKKLIDKVKTDKELRIFNPIGMSKYQFFCNQLKMLLSKTTYVTVILITND